MKPNKAAGVDGFESTFVKESLEEILEPLISLMSSLENEVVPEDWKIFVKYIGRVKSTLLFSVFLVKKLRLFCQIGIYSI